MLALLPGDNGLGTGTLVLGTFRLISLSSTKSNIGFRFSGDLTSGRGATGLLVMGVMAGGK